MSGGYPSGMGIVGCFAGVDRTNVRGFGIAGAGGSYGSYTTVIASTPCDTQFITVTGHSNASSNAGFSQAVKVAVGAAGSEVDIIKDLFVYCPTANWGTTIWHFPITIPAGTRIAMACNGNNSADTSYVAVHLYDSGLAGTESFMGVDSLGPTNGGSRGTTVTSGAIGVKGSYSPLIASTLRDYWGLAFGLSPSTAAAMTVDRGLVDFAIGAAGSEVPILADVFMANSGSVGSSGGHSSICLPVEIPAGSRVSVRMATGVATTSWGINAYGLYQ